VVAFQVCWENDKIFLMNLPKPIRKLIDAFERLPGVGPKTAARLTFYLLHVPQGELDKFAEALSLLKKDTILCSICFNVAEKDPCPICSDRNRDKSLICVVEQPLDILALEKTGDYQGIYHVLHGAISPLNNIGPDELRIKELLRRLKDNVSPVEEIILATNPNMEGEATAMYLAKKIKELKEEIKITRLGQGLPTGGDLEYADEVTLSRALEGRREY
jgi:recombination protein RecR